MQNHSGRPTGEDAEQIFRRYADTLFRFCFTLAGNQTDAEDAVSETMIRYITRAPAFDSEEHRKAWLLRVAANICPRHAPLSFAPYLCVLGGRV